VLKPLNVPPISTPGRRRDQTTTSRIPLSELALAPVPPGWTYAISRLDRSGRLAEQSTLRLLEWSPRDRYTMTCRSNEAVIIRRDPEGAFGLSARDRIKIPVTLRHRCGFHDGDRVLLAASKDADALLIYTMATLERLLLSQHEALITGGAS
jgi:hypothetical protein